MDGCKVAIVVPAYNEASTISNIIKTVREYGTPIVVDDGSTDNTGFLAKESGAVLVSHIRNMGYEEALNSGFKKADELDVNFIITIDADGQHNPILIKKFIDCFSANCDVVIGVRSKRQRFAEHLFAWYTNYFFGIKDPLCGMKAYKTSFYRTRGIFDSFRSVGTELAIFAARNGYKINQIEFEVKDRDGKSKFGDIISGNYKIIRAMIYTMTYAK